MPLIRVLVADDFEPWRHYIAALIESISGHEIAGFAEDGLKAVQIAAELQPDIVILDISMPGQSGIEAGRFIRMLAPKAKLVYVSQIAEADLVRTVFQFGAQAYIVKTDAAKDLKLALEAVQKGLRFVSTKLRHVLSTIDFPTE